jgi:hypothetical protein
VAPGQYAACHFPGELTAGLPRSTASAARATPALAVSGGQA